jgi:hypothetical protein
MNAWEFRVVYYWGISRVFPVSCYRYMGIHDWETWTDRESGTTYCQFRRLFCLAQEPDARGDCYLVYLKKGRTEKETGSQVLQMAERAAVDRLHAKRMYLQDAAHIDCPGGSASSSFDLGFRSLLSHGKTWYEARGYSLTLRRHRSSRIEGLVAHRRDVDDAVRRFSALPVSRIVEAVGRQVEAMKEGRGRATRANPSLFTTTANGSHVAEKTQLSLLRNRAKLLSLLKDAPRQARLGRWLLSLDCLSYSFYMRSMYGTRFGPGFAVADVAGLRTPSLDEFKRANWLRRNSHRLYWVKTIG